MAVKLAASIEPVNRCGIIQVAGNGPLRRILEYAFIRDVDTECIDEFLVLGIDVTHCPAKAQFAAAADQVIREDRLAFPFNTIDIGLTGIGCDTDKGVIDAVTIGVITDGARNLYVGVLGEEHRELGSHTTLQSGGLPAELEGLDGFRIKFHELENLVITDHAITIEIRRKGGLTTRVKTAALESFAVRSVKQVIVIRCQVERNPRGELGKGFRTMEIGGGCDRNRDYHRISARSRQSWFVSGPWKYVCPRYSDHREIR